MCSGSGVCVCVCVCVCMYVRCIGQILTVYQGMILYRCRLICCISLYACLSTSFEHSGVLVFVPLRGYQSFNV